MLNSTEHETSIAHKTKRLKINVKLLDAVFILHKNVKMPTIVVILLFMSRINSSSVELNLKNVL